MPAFTPEKLATWTGGAWTRLPGGAITGFNQDTRALTAGQVFVALNTGQRDGHDFLREAEAGGAVAALVSRTVAGATLPQLVTADPLGAFQRIAREQRREFHGTVVGVTGSAGKTSTKDLLALLLGGSPDVLATAGNLNNHIGVPLTLTRLDPAHRAAVIEAGVNRPGEMSALAEMIEPDHSLVTLVAPAHLEKLGSVEGVAAEKARLPAANRPGGVAVFPLSCWAYEPFRALANPLVLVPEGGGIKTDSGRTVKFSVSHRTGRTEVTLDGKRRFQLRRVSAGMAQNAALALALASELGVKDAVLQARLENWQPAKWRGELRQVGEAAVYCDFYNANPASMADAIEAFNAVVGAGQPRLYVLGSMEELGAEAAAYHRELGRRLHLRPGDFLFALGTQAAALREGLLENGNAAAQIVIVADVAPVRERLAGFKGAVFLKGSRRYQLETVLEPHAVHAH
ncbi:MAG: UDP-N-acetylmuramoyl-tripeptide--D-alanyl-D-alanine ligase [Opitutae bacterium]|nr:UDP-N-acetylmuramoyl-tripeptide--D-alanyl-D-alanine ligase [Opitutae bacterium]